MNREKAKEAIANLVEKVKKEKILEGEQLQMMEFFGTWWIIHLYNKGYKLVKE